MKYFILLFLNLTFLYTDSFAQNKQDYVWLFGLDHTPSPIDKGYRIDFNVKPFTIQVTNNGIGFAQNNASICDKDGNLLFYTNGCAVLNKEANIMPNGDSINEDIWKKLTGWDNCEGGYPGTQNIIILDDPANVDSGRRLYYILHKAIVFNGWYDDPLNQLRYTIVDMDMDGGLGDVTTIKDSTFYKQKQVLSSYLTAIRHQNGRDWWIIQPLEEDSSFVYFLLTKDGIELQGYQNSHEYFKKSLTSSAGTARFSPDGSKYALYTYNNQLNIYNFNRLNGKLSNYKKIYVFNPDSINPKNIWFSSVEWSPNSRFVYTATKTKLHQIDTWEEDLQDGVRLIDTYNGTIDPYHTIFFLMNLGPDCRIYMCPTSSTNSYHVINHPNRLGKACDFVQNGIKLPITSGAASMPNFPRFRVDEEDKCDSTIVSVFGDYVYYRRDLEVYPNPSSGIFNVRIPDRLGKGKLVVTNIYGQIIKKWEISGIFKEKQIDISGMPTGHYNIDVYPEKNPDRIVYSRQVVKVG